MWFHSSKKYAVLFFVFLGINSVASFCVAHGEGEYDYDTMQMIKLNHSLSFALQVLKDQESKKLVQKVLEDPSLINQPEISEKIDDILYRIDLIQELSEIKENIIDEATQERIQSWLDNELLLDDAKVREDAVRIINCIKLYNNLFSLQEKVNDEATKNLIRYWLANQSKLYDPEVRDRIKAIKYRVKLLKELVSIKKHINDSQTIKLVERWFSEPHLLDELEGRKQAEKVIICINVYMNLLALEPKIRDQKTKEQVAVWLAKQTLLDDPVLQKMVWALQIRIKHIEVLESIKDSIQDEASKEKIADWLAHTPKLDNLVVQQQVWRLVGRVRLVENLVAIQGKIKDEDTKKQVALWLNDHTLLDDPEQCKKACEIIEQVSQEQIKRLGEFIKKAKDKSLFMYMLYRKFMFLKMLDGGEAPGWLYWFLNNTVSTGYILAEVASRFLSGDVPDIDNPKEFNNFGNALGSTVNLLKGDDITGKIYNNIYDRLKCGSGSWNVCEREERDRVKRYGFPKHELDFFSALDSRFDRSLIEKPVDNLLKNMNLSASARDILWKNRVVRFMRQMALFKVLPTYLYWQGKVLCGEYKNNENAKLSEYIPLKEVVKSIGLSFRYKMVSFLIEQLNRGVDECGDGFLDRLDNKTLGIIGPNLVSKCTEMGVKGAMISVANRFKEGFLKKCDYFSLGKSNQELLATAGCTHIGKSVCSRFLARLFGVIRPPLFNAFAGKTKKFLKFLGRKKWISNAWGSDDTWNLLGMVPFVMVPIGYNFTLGDSPTISEHDYVRANKEVKRTGDPFCILDYLLAGWIAGDIAAWGTGKIVSKLKAGGVIS